MIDVKYKKKEFITNVNVSGHAMYDDYGHDIVCASVSSVVLNTLNIISIIDDDIIDATVDEGYVDINITYYNELVDKILLNLIEEMKSLEKTYAKNIRVKET